MRALAGWVSDDETGRAAHVIDGRRWRRGLVVIGCVALVLRVVLIITTPHFALIYDSADYEVHGAAISLGFGYPKSLAATPGTPSAFRPPAYPYLLGGVYWLFGIHPNLGRLVGALLGTVTVLLAAWLGAVVWDRRVGLIAGAATAVFPALIVLNGSLLSESLFLPIELGLTLTVVALRRTGPRLWLALLAGALCGLAALTRTVGVVFVIPILWAIIAGGSGWRERAQGVAVAVLSLVLVMTPWTIRNAEAFHAFVPLNTQTGITLAGVYNNEAGQDNYLEGIWRDFPEQTPDLARKLAPLYRRPGGINEVQLDHQLTRDALTYAAHHPTYVGVVSALNLLRMFDLGKGHTWTTDRSFAEMNVPASLRLLTTASLQLITLVALLGLIGRATSRRRFRPLGPPVLWAVPLLAVLATIPAEGSLRYGEIADPFIILIAAVTVTSARGARSPRSMVTTETPSMSLT